MTMRRLCLVAAMISMLMQLNAQTKTPPPQPQAQATPKKAGAAPKSATESDGERVFRENCSRCHNAPEGFSPRITGTIVRHMRVRANLSEKDVKALMSFFNPQ